MGRIALLIIILLIVVTAAIVGGSYLVVFWRDTTRRWRLEKEADQKRQLQEANEEFIKATEQLDSIIKSQDEVSR